jgi:hypothetical protein
VKHLACNNNELDELRVGEKVIVVAALLPKPESSLWRQLPSSEQKVRNEQVAVHYMAGSVRDFV